jgi:hypothetical protein
LRIGNLNSFLNFIHVIQEGIWAVAKKKNSDKDIERRMSTEEPWIDDTAYFFAHLLFEVNPVIDKLQAYEILFEMLTGPIDIDVARAYGQLIRATAFEPQSQHKH